MSDYVKTTNFTAKDALTTGDPLKLIKGSYFDTEFDALATASATKYDSADLASQAEAEGGAVNTTLMTPLRTEQWADVWGAENGGMIANIQALADPGADAFLIWDNSATDVVSAVLVAPVVSSATPDIGFDISGLTALTGAGIAGVDLLYMDNGAGGTGNSVQYMDFGIPLDDKIDDYTTVLADGNRFITLSNAAAKTVTIPANGTVAYPVGTVIVVMQKGAGQVDIAVTTDTVRAPSGQKCRTQYSVIQATKIAATEWVITGDSTT